MRTDLIESRLLSKFEFHEAHGRSHDHKWYELILPGLPVISTKISHGKNEVDKNIESKIARQLRVRTQYFRGMIECTNSREDYYKQVKDAPYPPWNVHL